MSTHPLPPSRPVGRRAAAFLAAFAAAALMLTTACSGDVHHTHKTFRGAVERGASCSELFDQRARFDNRETLVKIDRDLAEIGCTSPGAKRKG